jgi:UDP-N-acetylglucosamine acyltransferase
VIGAGVSIGSGCNIGPHVRIDGPTRIGERNVFVGSASIGTPPQDLKYVGEKTELVIGNENTIREFVTINRGTAGGGGITTIGSNNFFMAYAHVAHDCTVGNHTVFSNNATLAGHVSVGDYAILSGFAGIHQFCRIGAHAFIGMGCLVNGDVPPFVIVAADYGRPRGINSEGLKRRGFDGDRIAAIKRAYRTLYLGNRSLAEARTELAAIAADSKDVAVMLEFIEASERPLAR